MAGRNLCAVYDFELMPYALGDVLTWNVQTAIRCEELGRERVDAYICVDERFPSSIYQRDLVTAENCGLFFSELFGAFGTHPRLGSVLFYRQREDLLERLREQSKGDAENLESVADYECALESRGDESALIRYFTEHIHTHERINAFAQGHGRIPLLRPSMGCEPDVMGLIATRFAGKKIVPVHTRLRRLDAGLKAERTLTRDSDFLEWFEFLRDAAKKHPDVQFVLLGRLQEKPIEFLRLPNVMSVRAWGLGLGHELTLLLHSDLFIGTSSGFAAMANFSEIPYFITRMTPASCKAYCIASGAERLPFATERQILVYEPETRELLMRLLERGLEGAPPRPRSEGGPCIDAAIDVRGWEWERDQWLHPGATTYRFFNDAAYTDKESAFLVWPRVKEARAAWRTHAIDCAWELLTRIEAAFPRMSARYPEFLRLRGKLAGALGERVIEKSSRASLQRLAASDGSAQPLKRLQRYLRRGHPLVVRIKYVWRYKHRIPRRFVSIVRRLVSGLSRS